MSKVSPLVDGLIEAMQCLPGVGPKSAQRMVLHLLERNRDGGIMLADIMAKAIEGVGKCKKCRIFTESEFCSICSNEKRDKSFICVVESVSDVFAIEQSNQFNGNYFILHGHLSPIDDIGPEELALDKLFNLDRFNKAAALYDIEKLKWVNGQHLRSLDDESLIDEFKKIDNEFKKSFLEKKQSWQIQSSVS